MENFQRELRRAMEDATAQDPLWDLTPASVASEELPEGDVATVHLGEEPMNIEIFSQTNNLLAEHFPVQQEDEGSTTEDEDVQQEDEGSTTEDEDVYVETDSGEISYLSDPESYLSDPELNSEDEQIEMENEQRAAENPEYYYQSNDLDDSDDNQTNEENAEIRAQRRHGIRVFSAIESWMEAQFIMRLEQEMNHIKDNPRNIVWTNERLLIFKILCKTDIQETIQQLREGSILCPISQDSEE